MLTPAVTRGFGFISFKLRKILVNRGIFDSTFKPKEFFKPLGAPAKMRGSIDKSIDVLALARLYNVVRYREDRLPIDPNIFFWIRNWKMLLHVKQ